VFDFDWEEIAREHKMKAEEFRRLLSDTSVKVPEVGDRVIVAAGLVGMGHLWIREEAKVIEVGDTSVKVLFPERGLYGKDVEMWIHPALITDVIKEKR